MSKYAEDIGSIKANIETIFHRLNSLDSKLPKVMSAKIYRVIISIMSVGIISWLVLLTNYILRG